MTTASTSGEDSIDAGVPPPPEPIYVAMNNNNIKSGVVEIAKEEGVEKHPRLATKEVCGIDDIYASPHIDSDGRRIMTRKMSLGTSSPPQRTDCRHVGEYQKQDVSIHLQMILRLSVQKL